MSWNGCAWGCPDYNCSGCAPDIELKKEPIMSKPPQTGMQFKEKLEAFQQCATLLDKLSKEDRVSVLRSLNEWFGERKLNLGVTTSRDETRGDHECG